MKEHKLIGDIIDSIEEIRRELLYLEDVALALKKELMKRVSK